jgi:hypothetical protein
LGRGEAAVEKLLGWWYVEGVIGKTGNYAGGTSRTIFSSGASPFRGLHDQWPTHATNIPLVSYVQAASGNYYFFMDVLLKGSVSTWYFWLQPYTYAGIQLRYAQLAAANYQGGPGGFFGLGFNYGLRNLPFDKLSPADFTNVGNWLLAH